jgi:hypothetical protein
MWNEAIEVRTDMTPGVLLSAQREGRADGFAAAGDRQRAERARS